MRKFESRVFINTTLWERKIISGLIDTSGIPCKMASLNRAAEYGNSFIHACTDFSLWYIYHTCTCCVHNGDKCYKLSTVADRAFCKQLDLIQPCKTPHSFSTYKLKKTTTLFSSKNYKSSHVLTVTYIFTHICNGAFRANSVYLFM